MAATYILEGARWSPRRLSAFLDGWAARAPAPILARQPWQRRPAGPWTWLFPEGGIRGCSILLVPGLLHARALQVRLNLMASRSDWALAHALMRALIESEGGRVTGPDGKAMRVEALREPEAGVEAHNRLTADTRRLMRPLREGKPYVALPNPEFTLFVTPALQPAETDDTRFAAAFEDELAAMADRYQRATRVPVIELPDGSGLSVWGQDEALLYLTHYVGVRQGEGAAEGLVLAGPALLDALGDRIEVVSEDQDRFYLPALDAGRPQDARLLERLLKEGEPLDAWIGRLAGSREDTALIDLYGARRPTVTPR